MWKVVVLSLIFAGVALGGSRSQNPDDQDPEVMGFFPERPEIVMKAEPGLGDLLDWAKQKKENAKLPAAFISKYGYPVEEHKVTTNDGYILTMFRIPYGKKNGTSRERKQPVFVQHGLMSSAMDFLVTGPERALGFILADAGFDVWLGNTRGSTYSRNHEYLSPDAKEYWQFSWHEIGERDLPAEIDYVLKNTGYEKLHYIGHSQGTTAFFVMASLEPMMQSKIQTMNALAPIAYMSHLKSPFVRLLSPMAGVLGPVYNFTTTGEFMAKNEFMEQMGYYLCKQNSSINEMCVNTIYLIGGYGSNQLDPNQVSDILEYSPASSSFFQLMHYAQEVNSGKFAQYDYGASNNMKRYRTPNPPEYDPARITSRIALHYSDNDWLAAVVDVEKFANKLPNLIAKYRVPDPNFNHMDFCWGTGAKHEVYDRVIDIMYKYPITDFKQNNRMNWIGRGTH